MFNSDSIKLSVLSASSESDTSKPILLNSSFISLGEKLLTSSKCIFAFSKASYSSFKNKGSITNNEVKSVIVVNDHLLKPSDLIISAASCTTNCLAPVLNIIDRNFGIEYGFMTTIHAMTNDQNSLDGTHKKGINSRRGRASAYNIVPASTGAASAIGEVLPNLKGKLDGVAFRVPVSDGSVIDLSLTLVREASNNEINNTFKNHISEVLEYTEEPVVSSDVIGNKCGSLIDGLSTKVLDYDKHVVKIVAWYDNEIGYTAQMVRTMDKLLSI